jgi:Uma2 family endonuclease
MISRTRSATAEDLLGLREDGCRYELIAGEIKKMSPAGSEHGRIAGRIFLRLAGHVEQHDLGATYAAETGFRIGSDPDTVRAPDAAFVSNERLAMAEKTVGYLPLAPNLAVEVVSPGDSFSEVEAKAANWLEAGTEMVIVADPRTQTMRIYRDADTIEVLHAADTLEADPIVPGWSLAVRDALLL